MIFNSLPFFIFIGVFLPLYFTLKSKARLLLCLIGSYFFYGWWDYRFLSLVMFSTLIDYVVGLKLDKEEKGSKRKRLMLISILANLGFLGFFKYFNFFQESFISILNDMGMQAHPATLKILLPVGISFYTFQSMSYTIDVYWRKIKVEKDLIRFATFISFFPQLVAGPIVRARDFLPQFQKDRTFLWDRLISGTGQVLWGFFKKVAIADSLAPYVDQCFQSPEGFSSSHLLIGIVFYSFQIYCDFSGYSDIAIGLARVMGFDFPHNFRTPYFSRNFSEFWQRWHISLSSWLKDYLYIPLGGNRGGSFGSVFFIVLPLFLLSIFWSDSIQTTLIYLSILVIVSIITAYHMRKSEANMVKGFTYMNNMVTMLLGGLWHGASWVFYFWGFLHGTYLIIQRFLGKPFGHLMTAFRFPKPLQQAIDILIVYFFTCLAWVFFRAPDFDVAITYIQGIASLESFTITSIVNKFLVLKGFILIGMLLFVEISDFKFNYSQLIQKSPTFRVMSFVILLWIIAFFGSFGANAFIYFQF
ncbi:MAG: MBOAT family O-acyltransferase [Saprospiraceae bacterium]|nr:MBOAT family O-acyltransferase [Saprospiraceae bacterium]